VPRAAVVVVFVDDLVRVSYRDRVRVARKVWRTAIVCHVG